MVVRARNTIDHIVHYGSDKEKRLSQMTFTREREYSHFYELHTGAHLPPGHIDLRFRRKDHPLESWTIYGG